MKREITINLILVAAVLGIFATGSFIGNHAANLTSNYTTTTEMHRVDSGWAIDLITKDDTGKAREVIHNAYVMVDRPNPKSTTDDAYNGTNNGPFEIEN